MLLGNCPIPLVFDMIYLCVCDGYESSTASIYNGCVYKSYWHNNLKQQQQQQQQRDHNVAFI